MLLDAYKLFVQSKIEEADSIIDNILNNNVSVGGHNFDAIKDLDKAFTIKSEYEEKLNILHDYTPNDRDTPNTN
tara:strand:+ start:607 stop:828 length:222 start_codon:yes stop_codon:yes gene_type:complete